MLFRSKVEYKRVVSNGNGANGVNGAHRLLNGQNGSNPNIATVYARNIQSIESWPGRLWRTITGWVEGEGSQYWEYGQMFWVDYGGSETMRGWIIETKRRHKGELELGGLGPRDHAYNSPAGQFGRGQRAWRSAGGTAGVAWFSWRRAV